MKATFLCRSKDPHISTLLSTGSLVELDSWREGIFIHPPPRLTNEMKHASRSQCVPSSKLAILESFGGIWNSLDNRGRECQESNMPRTRSESGQDHAWVATWYQTEGHAMTRYRAQWEESFECKVKEERRNIDLCCQVSVCCHSSLGRGIMSLHSQLTSAAYDMRLSPSSVTPLGAPSSRI
jgi:hypothetical protein